ncbi:MAG: beta-propeller domain-containing protein [Actinobacteria bacterium]|nr:beta-propeller domain-containing protein [Actinomycetota bacterium]
MEERDIERHLERLAERGTPRGAGDVLDAARSAAVVRPLSAARRFAPVLAIAASVSLIGGIAAAIATRSHNDEPQFTASGVTTAPSTPLPEVSIPARLIAQSRLVRFSSCGTYTSYMRAKALQVVSPYGLPSLGGRWAGGGPAVLTSGAPEARSSAQGSEAGTPAAASAPAQGQDLKADTGGGDDFSTTNVQEAGIDEPDVVKTDGKRIYVLNNDTLFVVDAASPKILGSMRVGYATDLLLVDERVIVFTAPDEPRPQPGPQVDKAISSNGAVAASPVQYRQQARLRVIDVSNPAAPKETSHLDIDGNYISARLVNGVARVVLGAYPQHIPLAYPASNDPQAVQMALDKNKQTIRSAKFDDWTPHYTVTSGGKTSAERPTVSCDSAYRPPEFSGFGTLSVLSLDPKNPNGAKTASVVADGEIVYASATRLYVATNQWGPVRPMADNGVMPQVEPLPKTLVHAFDISDAAEAKYLVSGTVRGTVLNQFSMSEHQGNLRVATTDRDESFVTVLANQAGKVLAQVGQVGGLGKNERIYAVRFIGPVGYVVTFRQVDPLYVLNLTDPTKPRVVGELKITGYSAYLHPVGDNLLIGVGQEASAEGRRLGTQVSLFDVSNPASPKVLQRHMLGQGGSTAEFDHHAFLYWAPKKLTVIPIQTYGPDKGAPGFMGAVGLFTSPGDMHEVGRVSHGNFLVQRSLVVGGRLFTYSNGGIKVSNLDTFAEQSWVPFPNAQDPSGGGKTAPGRTVE